MSVRVWLGALISSALINGSTLADDVTTALRSLPTPPAIDGLIAFPLQKAGRATYLAIVTREAERAGLPAAIADAVAEVESGYRAEAFGRVGEVGLMQIRPQTAALLGYLGPVAGLFEPETNIHFGIKYLAQAWRLARGDLCRTLMKYRAGHGEERMTALSVNYCRRAREHLASIGTPAPQKGERAISASLTVAASQLPIPRTTRHIAEAPTRAAATGASTYFREVRVARTQARSGKATRTAADSARFWRAHEARIRELTRRARIAVRITAQSRS
jgi:hypothetical protein